MRSDAESWCVLRFGRPEPERFRAATRETPMKNLTRYRMARAAEYLSATRAGVREIARVTGYDSEVSVTEAFRRRYGTSPGTYRPVVN